MKPLFQFKHLDIVKTNTCMDATFNDSFRDVHSASDGLIVGGLHAIVFGQFIDLDLVIALSVSLQGGLLMMSYLSKLSNISNLLLFQATEVCSDSTVLQIDNTSEGLTGKRSDRGHRKVTSFGSEVWIMALKPMPTFPEPMISVRSVFSWPEPKN